MTDLKITLSRGRGEILLSSQVPEKIPEELATNINKITAAELKRICDTWGITRLKKYKLDELQNCIINYFEKKIYTFTYQTTNILLLDLLNIKINRTVVGKTQKNSETQHECIKNILENYGFGLLDVELNRKYIKANSYCHLSPGKYYINQPNGSQMCPDFLIIHVSPNGRHKDIKLECKIGHNKIVWNDGFPKEDILYLFSCTRYDDTKIFKGIDMSNPSALHFYKKFVDIKNRLNTEFRNDMKDNDFYATFRGAWSQNNIRDKKSDIKDISNIFDTFLSEDLETFPSCLLGISLFSGAGGDTYGMEMGGVNVIGFVEKDTAAVKTHINNFERSVHIGYDIKTITDEEFLTYNGKIDFLFGGFPCQSFSHGGKKDPRDPRGQLYVDFVRATNCIRPKWVIGENVKGILSRVNSEGECMADVVVEAFNTIGYTMTYKLINAVNFGIAQHRERVIFVGYKNDMKLNSPINIPGGNNCLSTLRDILEYSLEDAIIMPERISVPEGKFVIGDIKIEPTGSPPNNLVKCADNKTENDNITYKTRGKSTYSCVVDIDCISRALICTYNHMPRLFVPVFNGEKKYIRPYTVIECQRIQGFPDSFIFLDTKEKIIKQIGNAVPPVIIKEVVNYLKLLN